MWRAQVPGVGVEMERQVMRHIRRGSRVRWGFVMVQMADMCVAPEVVPRRFSYPEVKVGTQRRRRSRCLFTNAAQDQPWNLWAVRRCRGVPPRSVREQGRAKGQKSGRPGDGCK